MPATAIISWTTVLSALDDDAAFASTCCSCCVAASPSDLFSPASSTGRLVLFWALLKYSDDVSRRSGVACFVRAIELTRTTQQFQPTV